MSRLRGLAGWEVALLGAALAWAFAPVAVLVVDALGDGRTLTGADGPIPGDQLQYLAWIRDMADDGLAANLFDLAPSSHVFANPMFNLSGLLAALGVPIALTWWMWKPVAVLALAGGALMWVRRLLPGRPGAQAAGAVLALFSFSPLSAAVLWGDLGSATSRFEAYQPAGEMLAAAELWGYAQTAIAVGLMPAVILLVERALRGPGPRGAPLAWATAAGLAVSWLHPWQGVALVIVLAGLAVWPGGVNRSRALLLVPLAGLLLPLGYYGLLSETDGAWELAARANEVGHPPVWALGLALIPLGAAAATGLRAPGEDLVERSMLLWIAACLISYAAVQAFPPHALAGLSFPLGALAVRGFERLGAPVWLGIAAVALLTIPGLAYVARDFRDVRRSATQQLYLPADEARALEYVRRDAPAGGVVAPVRLATSIPSQTGRAVWVGHPSWSPGFTARATAVEDLFAGRLSPAAARALVRATGARVLVADCAARRPDLRPLLGRAIARSRTFGCARVYEVAA